MSLQYKAFLYEHRPCKAKEIRRFAVDQDVSSSYEYLRNKVASVFPNLGENNFALQWKDEDGDLIWFNSDEELMQALGQLNGDLFKIYIKENSSTTSNSFGGRERGPGGRCGFFRSENPGFPRWVPPFAQFDPNAFSQCPLFAQNGERQQTQSAPTNPPDSGNAQSPSNENTQVPPGLNGQNYLQNVGNAVADFLHPFGIDVDINVEHKGERSKCSGSQQAPPNEKPSTSADNPSKEKEDQNHSDSSDPDWTFVKDDEKSGGAKAKQGSHESDQMETDEDVRLREALNQLLAMGFSDHGGWLTHLLKSSDYNISRVLDAMQPARRPKE